jgi:glycosyltransferase involved in cell wall biosynthesis
VNAGQPRSLHVIGGKGSGGAERFAVRLINALARHGEPVAAVTVAGGEIARTIDPAVRQYHAPMLGSWDRWSRWKIDRAIRDFRPDIVQTYMGRATRIVNLPRGRLPVHLARLGGFYNLKGYRHAHAWIGNTRGIRDYLVEHGLPRDRVFHLGNFADAPGRVPAERLDALRAEYGLAGCRVVLGLGRLHPNKGWADLLRAFALLPDRLDGQALRLLMVGDGPLRTELEQLAAALGIAARVRWAGWQNDPAPWYQLADVFVCASIHEPLGNVILEAWANRAPLVSTRAQGPLELIRDGETGLLAAMGDPADLAAAIRSMLERNAAARARMADDGAAEIERHYTERAIVSSYAGLYAALRAQTSGIGRASR